MHRRALVARRLRMIDVGRGGLRPCMVGGVAVPWLMRHGWRGVDIWGRMTGRRGSLRLGMCHWGRVMMGWMRTIKRLRVYLVFLRANITDCIAAGAAIFHARGVFVAAFWTGHYFLLESEPPMRQMNGELHAILERFLTRRVNVFKKKLVKIFCRKDCLVLFALGLQGKLM